MTQEYKATIETQKQKEEPEPKDRGMVFICCPYCHPHGVTHPISIKDISILDANEPFDGYVTCRIHGRFYYPEIQTAPRVEISITHAVLEEEGIFIDMWGKRHPLNELDDYLQAIRGL